MFGLLSNLLMGLYGLPESTFRTSKNYLLFVQMDSNKYNLLSRCRKQRKIQNKKMASGNVSREPLRYLPEIQSDTNWTSLSVCDAEIELQEQNSREDMAGFSYPNLNLEQGEKNTENRRFIDRETGKEFCLLGTQ